jgi:UDP-N-acetyl-alpha-D-muramoyl-L-alanyl-L-glutamate epimerase
MLEYEESDIENGDALNIFEISDPEKEYFAFEDMKIMEKDTGGPLIVIFYYSICGERFFKSPMHLDSRWSVEDLDKSAMRVLLFSIGMSVLPWFWFGFGCPRILIKRKVVPKLSLSALAFWREAYDNILAEYLYLNVDRLPWEVQLDYESDTVTETGPDDSERELRSENDRKMNPELIEITPCQDYDVLVPIGGGKDSLVVWNKAVQAGKRPALMYVADGLEEYENSWRLRYIMKYAGGNVPSLVKHVFLDDVWLQVSRTSLTEEGVPWAMLVLFDSLLVACLMNIPRIHLGYERSADFGNGVMLRGREVNHQYDKSSTFLLLVNNYIGKEITASVAVESTLADMWEVEIARDFCLNSELRAYHGIFMSCNEPIDETRWCAKCDKCCFVFLLLSAFLPPVEVWAVFGENLFEKESLIPLFLRLLGKGEDKSKPFDCVGTADEASACVELASRKIAMEAMQSKTETETETELNFELPVVLAHLCHAIGIESWSAIPDEGIIRKHCGI